MRITAIQKMKVLGFTALLGLGLIACGGGASLPDLGGSTSSSSGGTIRVTNSTSADLGYVYVRTSGTTDWGSDLTNGSGFTSASGYKIAPGETGVISGVACDRTIDLRAQDYSSNEALRTNYYFSCSTTLAWTITSTGAGSSTTSSSTSSSGGASPKVHIFSRVGNKGASIYTKWDGASKGTLTKFYSADPTCGVAGTSGSDVIFTTTAGTHSFAASSSSSYTWGPTSYTTNTDTCKRIALY